MVFSREYGRFVDISEERLVSFPPVGMFPSDAGLSERVEAGRLEYKQPYTVNEIDLLADGDNPDALYRWAFRARRWRVLPPQGSSRTLAQVGDQCASTICEKMEQDLLAFAPATDDISFVVIKKI